MLRRASWRGLDVMVIVSLCCVWVVPCHFYNGFSRGFVREKWWCSVLLKTRTGTRSSEKEFLIFEFVLNLPQNPKP